jgi:diguanylate cyclase (GGDEF)-like protein
MPHSLYADNSQDEALARLTRLVRNILGVEIAAVSLIDGATQRFKSISGLEIAEIPLPQSFCRVPWREGRTIIIPDATKDEEFHDHPLVTEMKLRAYAGVPLKSSAGETFGTICAIQTSTRDFAERDIAVLEDLARIAETELELREHVNTDSLTGALTRRAFVRESARLAELVRRKRLQLSLIMMDVDHFKTINDTCSHAAGDEVLRAIAAACKISLRDYDLIGRLGGEEFAIAVEGDVDKALAVANRLKSAISALSFTFRGREVSVTASFGLCELGADGSIDEALQRADAALYEAKHDGRNRVVVAPVEGETTGAMA